MIELLLGGFGLWKVCGWITGPDERAERFRKQQEEDRRLRVLIRQREEMNELLRSRRP